MFQGIILIGINKLDRPFGNKKIVIYIKEKFLPEKSMRTDILKSLPRDLLTEYDRLTGLYIIHEEMIISIFFCTFTIIYWLSNIGYKFKYLVVLTILFFGIEIVIIFSYLFLRVQFNSFYNEYWADNPRRPRK
jgi:hypothetical protein